MAYIEARIPYDACPLCDHPEFSVIKVADCRHHAIYKPSIPSEMRWLACEKCEHVFIAGYFTDEALEILFSEVQPNQRPGFNLHHSRVISSRMVEKVCRELGQQSGRWLDVGFGNGALMTTAAEYGFDVMGLDLRTETVELMRLAGFEAEVLDLMEYQSPAKFDVVSMADVLEHMAYPRPALSKARELLNEDGLLFLSMPNSDCHAWKWLNQLDENPYWGEIEHYHNFGKRRLYALLREFGFEPVQYGISERYYICMEVIARRRA